MIFFVRRLGSVSEQERWLHQNRRLINLQMFLRKYPFMCYEVWEKTCGWVKYISGVETSSFTLLFSLNFLVDAL